jgi:hypothetical protein
MFSSFPHPLAGASRRPGAEAMRASARRLLNITGIVWRVTGMALMPQSAHVPRYAAHANRRQEASHGED